MILKPQPLTLFIENLPQGYWSHDLRRLFSNHGYIADAFVPQIQRNRVNGRFGFIEVQAWEQGEKLIHEVDGMVLGSSKIKVKWAKYPKPMGKLRRARIFGRGGVQLRMWKKSSNPRKMDAQESWRTNQPLNRLKMDDEIGQPMNTTKVIKVEKAQDNLEWLSLIHI